MLYLVTPTQQIAGGLQDFKEAFDIVGEKMHGAFGLSRCESVEQYLRTRPWLAKGNCYQLFAVDPSLPILAGCVRISPVLTQELCENHGFNLGYSVHPILWNNGYGTELLKQSYSVAYSLGLDEVWLCASKPASQRAILKSGAQLMFVDEKGWTFCYKF